MATNMPISKLEPVDPRVQYLACQVRNKTYHYILGEPSTTNAASAATSAPKDTVFLIHGFPDMGFGWRYQIPHLMDLGYRVVAPDMVGCGATDAPHGLDAYSHRSMAQDIKALAEHIVGPGEKIILGGHDMGGTVVWTTCLWQPDLVRAAFSVCTPFVDGGRGEYVSLQDLIASGKSQNWGYQLQLQGPEVEERIRGGDKIGQFLNAIYGGSTPEGEFGISLAKGVDFGILPHLGPSPLVSAAELEYQIQVLSRRSEQTPLRGMLNWYRVQRINYDESKELHASPTRFEMPSLLIAAKRDGAIPPSLAEGMGEMYRSLKIVEVDAGHWALWQASDEVNGHIGEWLESIGSK